MLHRNTAPVLVVHFPTPDLEFPLDPGIVGDQSHEKNVSTKAYWKRKARFTLSCPYGHCKWRKFAGLAVVQRLAHVCLRDFLSAAFERLSFGIDIACSNRLITARSSMTWAAESSAPGIF